MRASTCLSNYLILIGVILVLSGASINAASPYMVFTGEAGTDKFGWAVSSAGDVNNDGYDDVMIGAQGNDAGGSNAGRVYVFSGQTGDTLLVITGSNTGLLKYIGRVIAPVGDINEDNYDDLFINASNAAFVVSGLDGTTLFDFYGEGSSDQFGASIASAGDWDGNGSPDLIVGAPFYNGSGFTSTGKVYIYRGYDGYLIDTMSGTATNDNLGKSVATAKGYAGASMVGEVIIGGSLNLSSQYTGRAGVWGKSLLNGLIGVLDDYYGEAEWDDFSTSFTGTGVASAGDVNNDGYVDVIIGARKNSGDAGRAYVLSGGPSPDYGGDPLYVFNGDPGRSLMGESVASGDINGDGYSDLIVSAPGSGKVYVYSGHNGDTLMILESEEEFSAFGQVVACAGDVNADGYDDVIVGAYSYSAPGYQTGRAYVYLGGSSGGGSGCCTNPTGDINNDGSTTADISDLLFLVDYMFLPPGTADAPECMEEADVNGDGGSAPDISDLLYLVDYMFLPPGTAPGPADCL